MHTILALFDAPMPARGALQALIAAGFAPADIAVSHRMLDPEADAFGSPQSLPTEPSSLVADLVGRDVPATAAEVYAEAVRRGAILLAVTAPSLAAAAVRAAVDAFGVTDLDAHRSRFEADPALRYEWARHPAPILVPEPPPDIAGPAASDAGGARPSFSA